MRSQRRTLERNLSIIILHQALAGAMVWLPIMVLFTRERFGFDGALQLASIYYLAVVALEVPSGWTSDRFGRVLTLRIAAVSWVLAHACFLFGDDRFVVIAAGQVLLAGGFASLSGTDVSLHYDTLEGLGRADEYGQRQARLSSIGYRASAVSVLAGGALGLIDLRIAFAVALVASVVQLVVVSQLLEPPQRSDAESLLPQLARCLGYLKSSWMAWLFFYGIAMVTLEHVAFTPMQPWLTEVLDRPPDSLGSTPLLSGAVMAAVAGIGSLAARYSIDLAKRLGVVGALVGLGALSAGIVTVMAWTTSVVAIAFVLMRSVQGAAAPVILSSEIAPLTEPQHRATLLSLNSLAGRLGYGLILLAVSASANDDVLRVIGALAALAWGLVALTFVTGLAMSRRERSGGST